MIRHTLPSRNRRIWLGLMLGICALITLIALSDVRQGVTNEDRQSLLTNGIVNLIEVDRAASLNYADQAAQIKTIQARVNAKISGFEPIPIKHSREPDAVLSKQTGVCFDRARVIEKALRLSGFTVRRVYLLYSEKERSLLHTLLSSGIPSHTLVEVKTAKGWAFVGTLTNANGLTGSRPQSVRDVRELILKNGRSDWKEILDQDFTPLVGLYSRHGQHYWPYLPFPDISVRQMLSGLLDP